MKLLVSGWAGVEPDKLQAEGQPAGPLWLHQHSHSVSRWIPLRFRRQGVHFPSMNSGLAAIQLSSFSAPSGQVALRVHCMFDGCIMIGRPSGCAGWCGHAVGPGRGQEVVQPGCWRDHLLSVLLAQPLLAVRRHHQCHQGGPCTQLPSLVLCECMRLNIMTHRFSSYHKGIKHMCQQWKRHADR